jgi:xanthine dehydrogenase YagR molybdenum-binding subunit
MEPDPPGSNPDRLPLRTVINGQERTLDVAPHETALALLREQLGLVGAKEGCGHGACGACTVLVDGTPVAACLLPATSLEGRAVVSVEGLGPGIHPVQRAMVAEDALQCGYCTPGIVMEGVAFYERWKRERRGEEPTREEIGAAFAGHLCRCGAYPAIRAAIRKACRGDYEAGEVAPPRHEALEKVTGTARYAADIRLAGQLEGRILRSPHAHARVGRIDWEAARALPGVAAVALLLGRERRVRFAGQEILAVAAVDRETADAALKRVEIDYEVLPAAVGMDAARSDGAPIVHRGPLTRWRAPKVFEFGAVPARWRGNQRGPVRIFSRRARRARRAIARARGGTDGNANGKLVEGTWRTQVQCHTTLETHACVARWEGADELTVHLATQAAGRVAGEIARRWKLQRENVHVLAPHVGGGFGCKVYLTAEAVAAIELARAAGAPVRVALDRSEELLVGGVRPAQELRVALAADPRGALAGISLRSTAEAGVAVGSTTSHLFRIVYPRAALDLEDWDVVTHSTPGLPFRGPCGPPAFWSLEQAVDTMAGKLGEDPIALRRRWDANALRNRLYDWVETVPEWRDRPDPCADRGRFRRGLGVAVVTWLHFTDPRTRVKLEIRSGRVIASTACQDIGNGCRTVIARTVAGFLNLDPGEVEVRVGSSAHLHGPATIGSSTTSSLVPAAEAAARRLRERLVEFATTRFGLTEARADAGGVAHRGGELPWSRILAAAPPLETVGRRKRDAGGYFIPFPVGGTVVGKVLPAALQISEVIVDTRLGRIQVPRTWSCYGCGRIIAPRLARSQAEGGIAQSISYTLYEERRLDPRGALVSDDFERYQIAALGDAPEIHIEFLDTDLFERVSGGAVGLGEMVGLAPPASIGNAIAHATGWRPQELPIRPDRVLAGVAR